MMKKITGSIALVLAMAMLAIGFTACPLSISVGPPPAPGDVHISPDSGRYPGVQLTAFYNAPNLGVTYAWYTAADYYTTKLADGTTFTPSSPGTYIARASPPGYASKNSDPVIVDYKPHGGNLTITPNTDVFIGTELTVEYTGTADNITYQWSGPGTSDVTGTRYTPTQAGTYSVRVSTTNRNYTYLYSNSVTVSWPLLTGSVSISPAADGITGIPLNATYTGSVANVTYQWERKYSSSETDFSTISGATNPAYTPTQPGIYRVKVSAENCSPIYSSTVTVSWPLVGSVSVSPDTGVFTLTELTATYEGDLTVTYQWEKDSGSDFSSIIGQTGNKFTPAEPGAYRVRVSAAGNYSPAYSNTVTVSYLTLAGSVSVSSTNVVINTTLTASYTGSETVSYQWERRVGSSNFSSISGATTTTYTPTSPGIYRLKVSANGYETVYSDTVTVTYQSIDKTLFYGTWETDWVYDYNVRRNTKITITIDENMVEVEQVDSLNELLRYFRIEGISWELSKETDTNKTGTLYAGWDITGTVSGGVFLSTFSAYMQNSDKTRARFFGDSSSSGFLNSSGLYTKQE